MQRRLRPRPFRRATSGRCTRRVRAVSQAADALERAAELDKRSAPSPDLKTIRCTVRFLAEELVHAKDMRATAATTSTSRWTCRSRLAGHRELRKKGGDHLRGGRGERGRRGQRRRPWRQVGVARRQPDVRPLGWPDLQPLRHRACAAREQRLGVSVARTWWPLDLRAELGLLQGPASRHNIVNLLTTKGILMDGGITGRAPAIARGVHCRTGEGRGAVLDAIKGYESDDMFTAIPEIANSPKSHTRASSSATKT